MKHIIIGLTACGILSVAVTLAEAQGPDVPQYIHRPILLHVGEEGLDHGHFVYSEGAATPAPIAP